MSDEEERPSFTWGGAVASGAFLYHYTSAASLATILDSGTLRLGSYDRTNDPRENKQWTATFLGDPQHAPLPDVAAEAVDRLLRQSARVACFTRDAPLSADEERVFGRGYARARMWAQYADDHRGAVLVFDQWLLAQRINEQLAGTRHLYAAGDVKYVNRSMRDVLQFRLDDISVHGLDATLEHSQAQLIRELYFEKNTDWASENEYRYVVFPEVLDPAYIDIPFSDALVAIALGEAFPETEGSVLGTRLERLGCEVQVSKISWDSGMPQAVPLTTEWRLRQDHGS